ncbi:hypothetical protein KC365_g3 [Hortaea werneckii]|nr:hypothetical protein KC339_g3 [Hortaea werneckii]KAI7245896.1 hypothetical protein KC365_g3 [Hortaea werneckii]
MRAERHGRGVGDEEKVRVVVGVDGGRDEGCGVVFAPADHGCDVGEAALGDEGGRCVGDDVAVDNRHPFVADIRPRAIQVRGRLRRELRNSLLERNRLLSTVRKNIVMRSLSPPKDSICSFTHSSANLWSLIPAFADPSSVSAADFANPKTPNQSRRLRNRLVLRPYDKAPTMNEDHDRQPGIGSSPNRPLDIEMQAVFRDIGDVLKEQWCERSALLLWTCRSRYRRADLRAWCGNIRPRRLLHRCGRCLYMSHRRCSHMRLERRRSLSVLREATRRNRRRLIDDRFLLLFPARKFTWVYGALTSFGAAAESAGEAPRSTSNVRDTAADHGEEPMLERYKERRYSWMVMSYGPTSAACTCGTSLAAASESIPWTDGCCREGWSFLRCRHARGSSALRFSWRILSRPSKCPIARAEEWHRRGDDDDVQLD